MNIAKKILLFCLIAAFVASIIANVIMVRNNDDSLWKNKVMEILKKEEDVARLKQKAMVSFGLKAIEIPILKEIISIKCIPNEENKTVFCILQANYQYNQNIHLKYQAIKLNASNGQLKLEEYVGISSVH